MYFSIADRVLASFVTPREIGNADAKHGGVGDRLTFPVVRRAMGNCVAVRRVPAR